MRIYLVVILLLALSAIANGQVGPVFPYTSPSKEALMSLAKQESAKGETYRNYLVKSINIGLRDTTHKVETQEIDYIFDHIFLEEVNLQDGMFKNSGYDPSTNKMHPSSGHKIGWGFQWVFRVGTFTIVIIKRDCGNILEVPVIRRKVELPPEIPDRFIKTETEKDESNSASSEFIKTESTVTVNKSVTEIGGRKPFFKRKGIRVGGIVIGLIGVEELVRNLLIPALSSHKTAGVPGGAPPTPPPPIVPPVVPPPGGPGGAPTTK